MADLFNELPPLMPAIDSSEGCARVLDVADAGVARMNNDDGREYWCETIPMRVEALRAARCDAPACDTCSWCEGTGKLMQIKPGGWRAWRPNNEIDRGRWATPVWCPCCMGTGEAIGG